MVSTIDKKGNHQPKKYFEGEGKLDNIQKLTEQKLVTPEKLDDHDIENLCSKFLVNKIYYKMANQQNREDALQIAADVILNKGRMIKDQLDRNDLEIKKATEQKENKDQNFNRGNEDIKNNNQKSVAVEAPNPRQQPAEKVDITKISGGTLSEVIAKITEMLAGKSGADLKNGVDNFSAMIEVLAAPEVEKKFAETVGFLAKDPLLVVDIKDLLKDSKAAVIFSKAIENNFSNSEKKAVDEVKNDYLQSRRQENIDEGKNSGNQR